MIHTLADLTGTGAPVALMAGPPSKNTKANWIQFSVPLNASGNPTNAGQVRVGDKNVGANQGTIVTPYFGSQFPPISDGVYIDLTQVYFFAQTGDKIQVTYGVL